MQYHRHYHVGMICEKKNCPMMIVREKTMIDIGMILPILYMNVAESSPSFIPLVNRVRRNTSSMR